MDLRIKEFMSERNVTSAWLAEQVGSLSGSHRLALHGEVMTQCGDGLADAADFLLANGAVHNLVIGAIFCTGGGNLLLTDSFF